ncbi:MAG TPA: cytochrome P450, partial [Gemmatimonadaceae bacterium]|nr:cytochrome P450 [Gemmatimonadaceae bacterium]
PARFARSMFAPLTWSAHRVADLLAPARRIPGPRASYPGELIVRLRRNRLAFFGEMARHGDVTRIHLGPQPIALLMHPDDIRRVLVTEQRNFLRGRAVERTELLLGKGLLTSEGELHLRQRRLMQPAFHRERIAAYGSVMAAYARRLADSWRDGQVLDAHAAMMQLALAIAGRTLFDADVEGEARVVAEVMERSLRMFSMAVLPLGRALASLPLPWVREFHRARGHMDALIFRLIAERRARSDVEHPDLLSLLLAARDAEGDGGGMDDRQLRDEIVTLLMAGHETTANWLTWTWYLLARHPHVEACLHAELDDVLRGRPPEPDDVARLPYTRNVLSESLRLYPPAWALERRAIADFEAGGHRIRKGTQVIVSQYLVHRDPRWWHEPERFDPTRWAEPADATRPKFAYFPFGAGTRLCIGEHFAWMEAALVLATLAQRWRLRYARSQPPVPEPLITLRPRGGLPVLLERR